MISDLKIRFFTLVYNRKMCDVCRGGHGLGLPLYTYGHGVHRLLLFMLDAIVFFYFIFSSISFVALRYKFYSSKSNMLFSSLLKLVEE